MFGGVGTHLVHKIDLGAGVDADTHHGAHGRVHAWGGGAVTSGSPTLGTPQNPSHPPSARSTPPSPPLPVPQLPGYFCPGDIYRWPRDTG